VKQLARKGVGVGKEGPKLQFCQWGSEQVPCAPGYGGAWIQDHPQDSGIWEEAIKLPPKPKIREHVKAGKRSAPYLSDMFSYGQAGIFGARRRRGAAGGVYKGAMLHSGKARQHRLKSSIPEVWGLPPQEGGKYIENTQMPGLVKQMFDAHLERMNEVSPEFADTLLESGKQIHLAKRLNFGNAVPAKGWDSLAAKHAATAAGIVSPGDVDAILDRDAIARSKLPTRVVGDRTRQPQSSWVNEAAKHAARVHGIVNPNVVDKMLDRRRIEYELGTPTRIPGSKTKASGWVNAAAKNSAAVFGIVNPNTVDKMLSKNEIMKKPGIKVETDGKGEKAPGWTGLDAKKAASVFGIVNPNDVDRVLEGGQLAAASGTPMDENVPRGAVGGRGPETGAGGTAAQALDSRLRRAETAEMRKLDSLATVSLV